MQLTISCIGLYVDDGTEEEGIIALKNFFNRYNIQYMDLTSRDVNSGVIFKGDIKILWIPGGWAVPYNEKITDNGMQNIRDFVCAGNKLIGTCAGQYFIAENIIWESIKYSYRLNIFLGIISGPINIIAPWKSYKKTKINLNREHAINNGMPNQIDMVYYGGGEIWPDCEQPVFWVGQYDLTKTMAISTFKYGNGTVMLMGPHAELGINSDGSLNTDGGHLAQWEWLLNVVKWMSQQ